MLLINMEQEHTSFRRQLKPTVASVIVAGGSGLRCGGTLPKQYCDLAGEPVLAHTIRFFAAHPTVNNLVVVVAADMINHAGDIIRALNLDKPVQIIAGGARRQDSVLAGLLALEGSDIVMVHDGARPFPPENLQEALTRLSDASARSNEPCGVVFGMPATDSVKQATDDHVIRKTVPRHDLWTVQTPQIFPTGALIDALTQCDSDNAEVTDDASAFEHMGWPVHLVSGSRSNIKITYAEDFIVAEAILRSRQKTHAPGMTER